MALQLSQNDLTHIAFLGTFGKNGQISKDPDAATDAQSNFPDSEQQRINIDGY